MSASSSISLPFRSGFHLSHIKRGDEAAFVDHLADPEISKNLLAIPHPYLPSHADWWVSHCEQTVKTTNSIFAIRNSSGMLIGEIGIAGTWTQGDHKAEFGYWLARPYWGQGLMTASVRVFCDHVFTSLKVCRLFATPFVSSAASHRVLEKAGFEREGLMRSYHMKNSTPIDAVLYARFR